MRWPPDTWWFRALHYSGPHVVLWIAVFPDGALHVHRERQMERGTIGAVCAAIRQNTTHLDITARYTAAFKPQLLGTTKPSDDGDTRADTFRKHGVPSRELTHDPRQGWTRIGELLALRPTGTPALTIDPGCTYLIRALTNAVRDPANTEDILSSPQEQALIALRVGVMSRPAPTPFRKPPLPKEAVGHLLNDLLRDATKSRVAWR